MTNNLNVFSTPCGRDFVSLSHSLPLPPLPVNCNPIYAVPYLFASNLSYRGHALHVNQTRCPRVQCWVSLQFRSAFSPYHPLINTLSLSLSSSTAHLSSRPSEGNSTANRRVSSPSPGRAALDLAIGDLASDQETVPFEEASSPSASSGPRPQSLILKPIGVNLFPRLPLSPPPPPPPVDESSSFTAADQPLTMKLPASALRHSSTGSHSSASSHSGQASEISLSTLSANGAASGPAGGVPSPEEDITIFSELSTLRPNSSGGKDSQQQLTWKETAR